MIMMMYFCTADIQLQVDDVDDWVEGQVVI